MHDVALIAGVSQRTVSNVVRGYVHVRAETRERVQRAIEELNYRPNPSARSLREGRTGIIGLAIPLISSPYFAELADHVQRAASQRGLTLLMDQTGAERDRELLVLQGYRAHVIDGLLFSPMALTREDLVSLGTSMPTVLLGERIRDGGLVNVAIDNVEAAREATAHLLGAGRRRIAAIGADLTTKNVGAAMARLRGFEDAHHEFGVAVAPELVVTTGGSWSRASGHSAVQRLLDRGTRFDAVFCFNDELALGAVRALADHGLPVPDEVAVVGWDDIEEAQYAVPSLTSVSPDKGALAEAAVQALLSQINGATGGSDEIVGSYDLSIRESSTVRRRPHSRRNPR